MYEMEGDRDEVMAESVKLVRELCASEPVLKDLPTAAAPVRQKAADIPAVERLPDPSVHPRTEVRSLCEDSTLQKASLYRVRKAFLILLNQ